MKVVLTTPYYPPHIGGVEFHVRSLALKLARMGHEVEVVTSDGCDDVVRVVTVPSVPVPYSPIPLKFPELSADVYHSHIPSPFFALEVSKRGLKPHVVTYHNDVVVPERVNGWRIPQQIGRVVEDVNERITRSVLESADVVIATTKGYAETSPILKDFEVEIVPNAIDVDSYRYCEEKEDYVLYVGRLVEYKGLPTLMEAMGIVQRELDVRLIVAGDGEDRRRFERFAEKIGIRAEFLGRVSEGEKVDLLSKAKVLVLPSKSRLEAFGIVLLEAMACGTPVIASDVPGVRDVALEGGLVFRDVEDLAEKIANLVTDRKKRIALGRRGRRAVEGKFCWDVVVRKIERIYSSV